MQVIPSAANEHLIKMAIREPVVLKAGDEEIAFVLSKKDYYRMKQQNIDSFNNLCDEIGARAEMRGLTEEKLNQLLSDES